VDLTALARGAADLLADPERERVRFVDAFDGPCVVVGEPVRIDRAIGNLLSNALKYSTDAVQVRLERRGAFAAVVVIDQGVGIPSEDLSRVFDRYYRARSGVHVTGGFGLGLYITRLIAEANGGRAEVTSTLGAGSSFSLVLPLGAPASEALP
jgi:signal transduction histidine kinase